MKIISNDFAKIKNIKKIKIGIVGFGKLGKACADQIKKRQEFELVGIFSRRTIEGTIPLDQIVNYKNKIDVLLMCVGSSDDAPTIIPHLAQNFNTVDSFDNHSKLPEYIRSIKTKKVCIAATGWDPGLFSVLRLYLTATMPEGILQTFWGKGVSLGHTNAIKQIDGIRDAIQFTVPKPEAILEAKKGIYVLPRNRHKRICNIVTATKATSNNNESIANKIKQIPNYFAGQETEVNFVKSITPKSYHAGQVIATDGTTSAHFKLDLKDNAQFTAQVMLAYALANYSLQRDKQRGVFTVADIAPKHLFLNNCHIDLI